MNKYVEFDMRVGRLLNERNSVSDAFKAIVRDRNLPLAERVEVWEDHASLLLEMGDWLSQSPIAIDTNFAQRGETIYFEDLLETLVTVDDMSDLYQISDEDLWQRLDMPEYSNIRERFEKVLTSNYYATKVDW